MHENAIRGVLASIAIDFGIPIIWTKNFRETAAQLSWIAKREQINGKREIKIRAEKKPLSTQQQQEYIVSGLPFVNTKLSKRLLKKFKTPKKVFSSKPEKLMQIDGIGKEKSKKIWELLNKEYE
jgi:Fanconi anemia group M protein